MTIIQLDNRENKKNSLEKTKIYLKHDYCLPSTETLIHTLSKNLIGNSKVAACYVMLSIVGIFKA